MLQLVKFERCEYVGIRARGWRRGCNIIFRATLNFGGKTSSQKWKKTFFVFIERPARWSTRNLGSLLLLGGVSRQSNSAWNYIYDANSFSYSCIW